MAYNLFIINEEIIFNTNTFELKPIKNPDEVITLNAPTARCLKLLLEKVGQVVSREDFMQEVWQSRGIVVSQNTFYQNISLLRKSVQRVGLSSDVIATVRGVGFIFSSEISVRLIEDDSYQDHADTHTVSGRGTSTLIKGSTNAIPNFINRSLNENLSVNFDKPHLRIPKWLLVLIIICVVLEVFSIIIRYTE